MIRSANTSCSWSLMPRVLDGTSTAAQIDAVARLVADVGIAVDMDLGAQVVQLVHRVRRHGGARDALQLPADNGRGEPQRAVGGVWWAAGTNVVATRLW